MEIIKQGQYQPIAVEHQVMIIYAAVNGYLKGIQTEYVQEFEKEFYQYMEEHYPEVGVAIASTGMLDKETEKLLIQGITQCRKEGKFSG